MKRPSAGRRAAELYGRLLSWSLDRPLAVLGAAAAAVALGSFAGSRVPTDFLPEADEGSYVVDYFAPVGASLADADALAGRLESVLRETPEVAAFSRRLGTELGPPVATLPSRGDIAVRLKDDRRRAVDEIMDDQRGKMAAVAPGLRIEFVQVLADMLGDLQGSPEPVEVRIYGPDLLVLRDLAKQAAERTADLPGLVDRFSGDEGCAPEVDLRVSPLQAGRQGLSASSIADQLAGAFLGEVATQLRKPDHLEDVRVRVAQPTGDEPPPQEALERATVAGTSGMALPVRAVAEPERSCPPASLLRQNQRNMVHLTARLSGVNLGTAVDAVRKKLAGWQLPIGYAWELGGLYQQQQESFSSLLAVLALALAAVAAVLLFQLRSWARTASVLAAAPLGLAGGAATLLLTRTALNVSSLMGAILLVGLVVKNGILLLDHALWSEEAGKPLHEALIEAGRARLRPILMTTLATLAALLPLLIGLGAGSSLHRPLAVMVVGGLLFSTAATLLVVPAAASALAKLRGLRGPRGIP